MTHTAETSRGFTLVELIIVIVIVGMLAALAVPKFITSLERSNAAEAFQYLSTMQTAQERYRAEHGRYASKTSELDVTLPDLQYFESNGIDEVEHESFETAWRVTLTRRGARERFGAYTVVFDQRGFDEQRSTITRLPAVNPGNRRAGR